MNPRLSQEGGTGQLVGVDTDEELVLDIEVDVGSSLVMEGRLELGVRLTVGLELGIDSEDVRVNSELVVGHGASE